MKKGFKKIGVLLTALSVFALASCGNNETTKADGVDENENYYSELASTSDGVSIANSLTANSINNGNIFHAWNWSMSTISSNLDSIKNAGFTTIQTSPMQPQKDYWAGNTAKDAWWKLYQPLGFSIATKNNALGTKSELTSMVSKAHQKGLKVIVDVVANHLAGSYNQLDGAVKEYEPTIYGSNGNLSGGAMLHSETLYGANDGANTTNGNIGLPDLNTHHSHVQNRVLSLCKEYIDCGVDGFRFDAAKHIETDNSSEPYGASQFWPTVINGTTSYAKSKGKATPYYYGEILYSCGNNRSYSWYTKYMDVIDNRCGNDLRNSFNSGYASASSYYNSTGFSSGERVVVWGESHDTYANDEHESTNVSIYNVNKAYAIMGARNGAKCLYLARPTDSTGTSAWNSCSTKLGAKGSSAYTWTEVGAINKFRNYWGTSNEYIYNSSNFAQVVRYNSSESGMVLVSGNGNKTASNVSVPSVMKNGSYKDLITGNTFTVSSGKVSGQLGDCGIAVLYSTSSSNTGSGSNTGSNTNMDMNTVYFVNTKNWSNVYVYAWEGNGGSGHQNATWPGVKMTKTSEKVNGYYVWKYTSTNFLSKWDHLIFTNNSGAQTNDIAITYNQYDGNGNATLRSTSSGNETNNNNTIYFINTKNWSNVYVYAWEGNGGSGHQNSAWPGVKMTNTGKKVNGYYVYSYTQTDFFDKWQKVVFSNGSGSQTADSTLTKNCYNYSGTASDYNG